MIVCHSSIIPLSDIVGDLAVTTVVKEGIEYTYCRNGSSEVYVCYADFNTSELVLNRVRATFPNASRFIVGVVSSKVYNTGTVFTPEIGWKLMLTDTDRWHPIYRPVSHWPSPSIYDRFLRYVLVRAQLLGHDTRPEVLSLAEANRAWIEANPDVQISLHGSLIGNNEDFQQQLEKAIHNGDFIVSHHTLSDDALYRLHAAVTYDPLFPSQLPFQRPTPVNGALANLDPSDVVSAAQMGLTYYGARQFTPILGVMNFSDMSRFGGDRKLIIEYLSFLSLSAALGLILQI